MHIIYFPWVVRANVDCLANHIYIYVKIGRHTVLLNVFELLALWCCGKGMIFYQLSMWYSMINITMTHNGRDGVSNHQPHDCLLNRLFRRRSKKTSKLRFTGLCAGNSPGTGEFPAQMASSAENVSIWWRHHVIDLSVITAIAGRCRQWVAELTPAKYEIFRRIRSIFCSSRNVCNCEKP